MKGAIRWYCPSSDDGILVDANGNEFYFNSWSFKDTRYKVTGKCKKTGKTITISTRLYPGMCVNYEHVRSWVCSTLGGNEFVEFKQAPGINKPWAVEIEVLEVSQELKSWLK